MAHDAPGAPRAPGVARPDPAGRPRRVAARAASSTASASTASRASRRRRGSRELIARTTRRRRASTTSLDVLSARCSSGPTDSLAGAPGGPALPDALDRRAARVRRPPVARPTRCRIPTQPATGSLLVQVVAAGTDLDKPPPDAARRLARQPARAPRAAAARDRRPDRPALQRHARCGSSTRRAASRPAT